MTALTWSCYRAFGTDLSDDHDVWTEQHVAGRGADRVQALAWLNRTLAGDLTGRTGWRSGYWHLVYSSAARALGSGTPWQYVIDRPQWTWIAWALIPDIDTADGGRR